MATQVDEVILSETEPIDAEVAAQLFYSTAEPIYDFFFNNNREAMMGFLADSWQKSEGIWSHKFCKRHSL